MQYINMFTNEQIMLASIIAVLLCIIGIMILLAKEDYENALEEQKIQEAYKELEVTSELTFPDGTVVPVTKSRLDEIWEGMKRPKGNLLDIFS